MFILIRFGVQILHRRTPSPLQQDDMVIVGCCCAFKSLSTALPKIVSAKDANRDSGHMKWLLNSPMIDILPAR
jgi:hypothetical protein